MTPEQAIEVLRQASAQAPLVLEGHITVQKALDVLKWLLPSEVVEEPA